MLEEIDGYQLSEWAALYAIDEEERKRDELARNAEAGVKNRRRRGR